MFLPQIPGMEELSGLPSWGHTELDRLKQQQLPCAYANYSKLKSTAKFWKFIFTDLFIKVANREKLYKATNFVWELYMMDDISVISNFLAHESVYT